MFKILFNALILIKITGYIIFNLNEILFLSLLLIIVLSLSPQTGSREALGNEHMCSLKGSFLVQRRPFSQLLVEDANWPILQVEGYYIP